MNKFSIAPMIFAALTGSAFAETYHTLDYSMFIPGTHGGLG